MWRARISCVHFEHEFSANGRAAPGLLAQSSLGESIIPEEFMELAHVKRMEHGLTSYVRRIVWSLCVILITERM